MFFNKIRLFFFSIKLKAVADCLSLFQFYRMVLDSLSDNLAIPLNNPNEKIGMESLKTQTEKLEIFRDVFFCHLIRLTSSNKCLKKNLSPLFSEYQAKTVEQYSMSKSGCVLQNKNWQHHVWRF